MQHCSHVPRRSYASPTNARNTDMLHSHHCFAHVTTRHTHAVLRYITCTCHMSTHSNVQLPTATVSAPCTCKVTPESVTDIYEQSAVFRLLPRNAHCCMQPFNAMICRHNMSRSSLLILHLFLRSSARIQLYMHIFPFP